MTQSALPGGDLVTDGLADIQRGAVTVAALLVSIGAPQLARAGIVVAQPLPDPEHRLYDLLSRTHGAAAHSRYNSLIRRLVSFERAALCAH